MADLQKAAQPLVAQKPVDKTKIWVVLCGGAAGLFALTVLAENMKQLFPAIARANEALAAQRTGPSKPAAEPAETPDTSQDKWIDTDASPKQPSDSSEQAVLAGLQAARERSGSESKPGEADSQESKDAASRDSTPKAKP